MARGLRETSHGSLSKPKGKRTWSISEILATVPLLRVPACPTEKRARGDVTRGTDGLRNAPRLSPDDVPLVARSLLHRGSSCEAEVAHANKTSCGSSPCRRARRGGLSSCARTDRVVGIRRRPRAGRLWSLSKTCAHSPAGSPEAAQRRGRTECERAPPSARSADRTHQGRVRPAHRGRTEGTAGARRPDRLGRRGLGSVRGGVSQRVA